MLTRPSTRFFFELSSGLDSRVTLLSVVDPESLGEDEQAAINTDEGRGRIERPYLDSLTKLADSVDYERSKIDALVRFGRPAGEIISTGREWFQLDRHAHSRQGSDPKGFPGKRHGRGHKALRDTDHHCGARLTRTSYLNVSKR